MPSNIKRAAIALVISLISTSVAVYFDGLTFEEISFSDSFTLGINTVWALIIAWVIWDLFRGKDIKLTLIQVGAIMLVAAYFLVNSKEDVKWRSEKSL